MNNANLWREIYDRLLTIPDYQTGVMVRLPESLGGESRFYFAGK